MYHNVAYLAAYCYTSKPTPSSSIIFWILLAYAGTVRTSHFIPFYPPSSDCLIDKVVNPWVCELSSWALIPLFSEWLLKSQSFFIFSTMVNSLWGIDSHAFKLNSQLQWLVPSHNSELPTSIPKNLQAQSAAKRGKALWTCSQVQQSNSSSLVFPGTSACQVARG